MMCRKLARIGAHWYPRKSNTCLSSAASWKGEGKGELELLHPECLLSRVFDTLPEQIPAAAEGGTPFPQQFAASEPGQ